MKTVMVVVDVNNSEECQDEYENSFHNKGGKMSDLQSIWKKCIRRMQYCGRLPKNVTWPVYKT